MKKLLLIIAIFYFLTSAQGQEFSFQMNFVDAVGNKDSLVIGYDVNGTANIDAAFGETNIIGTPLNPTFDVRISNEWFNRNFLATNGTYHTKKQIIHNDCSSWFAIQSIDIKAKHWPVTASWDNSLFNSTCRNGSVFTSVNPGGWWNSGSPSDLWRLEFLAYNAATFTSNYSGGYNRHFAYINNNADTISVFWQAFADSSLLVLSVKDVSVTNQELKVFPNPATEKISIQVPTNFGFVNKIEIFSSLGQLVKTTNKSNDIDFSQFEKGIYLVIVTNDNGNKLWTRTVKE